MNMLNNSEKPYRSMAAKKKAAAKSKSKKKSK